MSIITFPTLYKRDSKGKIREWRLEIEGDRYRSVAGLQDGKQVTSEWRVAIPASQETGEQQAIFEVEAAYKKALDRDYFKSVVEVDTPRIFEPMLAHVYKKWNGPCWSQPKLDGIRCVAKETGLYSREGKEFLSVPHIFEALRPLFEANPDLVIDGELYNHELKEDFNSISSLVRKKKPTEEDLTKSAQLIQYHIYDQYSETSFEERFVEIERLVENLGDPRLRVVRSTLCNSLEELDTIYGEYLADVYEGQMVRYMNVPYEKKRSRSLLKRKEFITAEFKVKRIEEGQGNWAGHAKRVVCEREDGTEFAAGIRGNKEFTKQLLVGVPQYNLVTLRFPSYTPDGIPRFGVAVDWHFNARED